MLIRFYINDKPWNALLIVTSQHDSADKVSPFKLNAGMNMQYGKLRNNRSLKVDKAYFLRDDPRLNDWTM